MEFIKRKGNLCFLLALVAIIAGQQYESPVSVFVGLLLVAIGVGVKTGFLSMRVEVDVDRQDEKPDS